MIDREPIPMPTPAQRDRAVAAILAQGLPPREPLGKRILRTARTLPPSVLFFGVGDCLFLAVLLALVCLPPVAMVAQREAPPSLLFLFSPGPLCAAARADPVEGRDEPYAGMEAGLQDLPSYAHCLADAGVWRGGGGSVRTG